MKNILIIGCGLLGSSLVRRISKEKLAKKIFIYEKSKNNIQKIKRLKLKAVVTKKLSLAVSKSEFIIFCTPMSEYKKIILKINKDLTSKHRITDIGSSKIKSLKIIKQNLTKKALWISSHPIAGSEVSGPEHGKQDLFENKWCVLIKENSTDLKFFTFLSLFWKKMGSKIISMTSKKHDKIFSITSHLPHLIAYNLVKSAQDFEKKQNYNLIRYSAGGLRDFSRIAASNEIMWRDIFFDNKKNIVKAIDLFIKNLKKFKSDIKFENNKSILKKLIQTKKVRTQIIKLKQDVSKPDFGRN
tara:strand:- start:1150 stop:2046 length:897 start_codon:yes stop_codon:yes gene_type:complete